KRDGELRKLDQHVVPLIDLGDPVGLCLFDNLVGNMNFIARQDLQSGVADGCVQRRYALEDLYWFWIRRQAIEHVWSRYHVLDAIGRSNTRHFQCFVKITGAVVDRRHDVGVDIDHCRTLLTSVSPKLSSQTLPFNRLSNFFEGIRRSRNVAKSELAVNGIVNWRQ